MTAVSDAHRSGCLRGLRILVVEDEALIAMAYEDLLADLGWFLVGPAPSVAQALAILATDRPSAALLDVNLDGEISAPVAARLHRSGIPFLVVTGSAAAQAGRAGGADPGDAGGVLRGQGVGSTPTWRGGGSRLTIR